LTIAPQRSQASSPPAAPDDHQHLWPERAGFKLAEANELGVKVVSPEAFAEVVAQFLD
jgi:hypothetical protein